MPNKVKAIRKGGHMSFDVTSNISLSNVQASAKSCPGGGGNTGYFQRNGEEEEQQKKAKDYSNDSFEKQEVLKEIEEESFAVIFLNLFKDIIEAIGNFFRK